MKSSFDFCCICIQSGPDLESIMIKDENNINYRDKLSICEPNQDWNDKTLNLCKLCIDKLNMSYDFIELCKKSEILRANKLLELEKEFQNKNAEKNSFTCDTCQKTFNQKRSLKVHITRMHLGSGNPKQKLKVESNETEEKENDQRSDPNVEAAQAEENQKDLENHASSKTNNLYSNEDDFSADNNDELYSSEEDLIEKPKRQRRTKKTKKPESFTCEYCGKQFNRHQHWSAHIRSKHTFEKPYKCKLCDASFVTSHSLLVHKRNHNNEKPYICSSCGKGFVCSGDLFHHTKIHLNKKEYQCNICDKRFNTTSILRTHKIVKHTEPKDWKYVCTLCNRRFPINSGLSLHLKRHSGVKDHSCHICGKKFFNKSEVTKHIFSHSNHKNFKCSYCDCKEYKNKEGLNKHLKLVHDIGDWKAPKLEKKFLCPLCPKMFTFNNKLQRHMVVHTGEKPFKCEYCEKKFSANYYRKTHMRKEHNVEIDDDVTRVVSIMVPGI